MWPATILIIPYKLNKTLTFSNVYFLKTDFEDKWKNILKQLFLSFEHWKLGFGDHQQMLIIPEKTLEVIVGHFGVIVDFLS